MTKQSCAFLFLKSLLKKNNQLPLNNQKNQNENINISLLYLFLLLISVLRVLLICSLFHPAPKRIDLNLPYRAFKTVPVQKQEEPNILGKKHPKCEK